MGEGSVERVILDCNCKSLLILYIYIPQLQYASLFRITIIFSTTPRVHDSSEETRSVASPHGEHISVMEDEAQ